MSQPSDSIHVLSFKSRARVAAAQSVTLENPTEKNWFITPVLKGEHWQGAGQLQVRPPRATTWTWASKRCYTFHTMLYFLVCTKMSVLIDRPLEP